jgi:proline racemase
MWLIVDGESGGFEARAEAWARRQRQSVLRVVDSHTAGNPTRIVVGGLELPIGVQTVPEVRDWLRVEHDWVRRRLNHEPRGGALTCSVVPLPPTDDSHDLGAVILEPGSYPPMCGHCVIGLATVVDQLGLASGRPAEGGGRAYRIRVPAGLVTVTVRPHGAGLLATLANVESYVVDSWNEILGGRPVTCTVLYGGDYYPTVDAAELGFALDRTSADDIIRFARELSEKVRDRVVFDPVAGSTPDIYQVMFFQDTESSPPAANTAVVAPPGAIDRSPCGTGSSALMALKVARGELAPGQPLITRSVIGSEFRVEAASVRDAESGPVVTPLVTGSAHITGFSTVVGDPTDRLVDGFAPL